MLVLDATDRIAFMQSLQFCFVKKSKLGKGRHLTQRFCCGFASGCTLQFVL